MITGVRLRNFTAFRKLDVGFSKGINVFVGRNSTGKTHLMKVAYAACDVTGTKLNFGEKLVGTLQPEEYRPGRMVHRHPGSSQASVEVFGDKTRIRASFSNNCETPQAVSITGAGAWASSPVDCAYIPANETLADASRLESACNATGARIGGIFDDILFRACRPATRQRVGKRRQKLLNDLKMAMGGVVQVESDTFYLKNRGGKTEFSLLSAGMCKIGLLWILIHNRTLSNGAVLFWDEPETNLSPDLAGVVVGVLLELQRAGVQIFLATHDYVMLKELDLQGQRNSRIAFHSLYFDGDGKTLRHRRATTYAEIFPNVVADAIGSLYDREVRRSLGISS